MTLRAILASFHVLAAVIWVGGIFFMQIIMRRVTADMEPPVRQNTMVKVFTYFFQWVWISVAVILITGFGIIYGVYGGFGNLSFATFKHIHIMLLIGLIMTAVFFYIYFGPFKGLLKARENGDPKRAAHQIQYIRMFGTVNLILGISLILLVQLLQG